MLPLARAVPPNVQEFEDPSGKRAYFALEASYAVFIYIIYFIALSSEPRGVCVGVLPDVQVIQLATWEYPEEREERWEECSDNKVRFEA